MADHEHYSPIIGITVVFSLPMALYTGFLRFPQVNIPLTYHSNGTNSESYRTHVIKSQERARYSKLYREILGVVQERCIVIRQNSS